MSKTTIAYRVDNRSFTVGSVIDLSIPTYFAELKTKELQLQTKLQTDSSLWKRWYLITLKIKVENKLEIHRSNFYLYPTKPIRYDNVFLFKNLQDAQNFSRKFSIPNLYEVEIDEKNILHIGDYSCLDILMSALDKTDPEATVSELSQIMDDYWSGKFTDNPVIEFIVNPSTAEVIRII